MTTDGEFLDCTIVIPTHRRAAYLRRAVTWFSRLGWPIVVADSSDAPSLAPDQRALVETYLHRPGGFEVYASKLADAAAAVRTPFVAMCADDDFILPEGLAQCIAFLRRNDDYVFAQGYAYLYQVFGERVVAWPMPYHTHDIPQDDWRDRVETATSTVFYGVQRTTVLRHSIGFLARTGLAPLGSDAIGLIDFALTKIAARQGKFHRAPIAFAMREYSPFVSGVGYRFRTIVSPIIPTFYGALLDELARDSATDDVTRLRLLRLFGADYAGQIQYDLSVGTTQMRRLERLPGLIRSNARLVAGVELAWRQVVAWYLFRQRAYRGQDAVFRAPSYPLFRTAVLRGI